MKRQLIVNTCHGGGKVKRQFKFSKKDGQLWVNIHDGNYLYCSPFRADFVDDIIKEGQECVIVLKGSNKHYLDFDENYPMGYINEMYFTDSPDQSLTEVSISDLLRCL